MSLNARNRVPAIDVLQIDYEYVKISYYAEGAVNDLGEPSRTLTERNTNVRCSLDQLLSTPSYINQAGTRSIIQQGIVENASFILTLLASADIQGGDLVEDFDGDTYDVIHVVDWHTHIEAFLRKVT